MERIRVSSSNVSSIGYDLETQTLEVKFHSGGLYHYYVPQSIYQSFLNADSKGQFVHRMLKRFRYKQIN